jgi:O-methyltransferase involved in polyketide biosynthesis
MSTLEGARKMAANYSAMVKLFDKQVREEKNWDGLDFNFCRAHTVDALIVEAVADGSPIRQTVFCGVGQDYRGMHYSDAIHARGIKVFELDLPPMMDLREKVKARICEVNKGLVLPETYALPIDFDKESVSEVLLTCARYDPTLPTPYLWEGVMYYLQPEAMESFFKTFIWKIFSRFLRTRINRPRNFRNLLNIFGSLKLPLFKCRISVYALTPKLRTLLFENCVCFYHAIACALL